jgi:hypothetical protein
VKRQVKAQDTLPGTEVERHPMWDAPRLSGVPGVDTPHIHALRQEIARKLTPFDGRPGVQTDAVVEFCKHVFTASVLITAHRDPLWLLGQIAVAYHRSRRNDMPAVKVFRDAFDDTVIRNSNIL